MKTSKLRAKHISLFEAHLREEEYSRLTIEKYTRDAECFRRWLNGKRITKESLIDYKSYLAATYAPPSVNAALSSLRCFFAFLGQNDLKIKNLKIQKSLFLSAEKEMNKDEYKRLLSAAQKKKNERLFLLLQTVCATGIRVSELRFITPQALRKGYADVRNKGKCRRVFLPSMLCRMLEEYCRRQKRERGAVFVTRKGNPLDRSNIWAEMKKLCREAEVCEKKVFPHNLRHLFARTYYSMQKDIVRLADILGHANIDTTRIYTAESGEAHRAQIEALNLCSTDTA